jgi:hypothetical protein
MLLLGNSHKRETRYERAKIYVDKKAPSWICMMKRTFLKTATEIKSYRRYGLQS